MTHNRFLVQLTPTSDSEAGASASQYKRPLPYHSSLATILVYAFLPFLNPRVPISLVGVSRILQPLCPNSKAAWHMFQIAVQQTCTCAVQLIKRVSVFQSNHSAESHTYRCRQIEDFVNRITSLQRSFHSLRATSRQMLFTAFPNSSRL